MPTSKYYYVFLTLTIALYFTASKYLFDEVFNASKIIIDELFHLPQGLEYCKGNFSYWDPKITTLPGLYLTSAALVGYAFECNVYNLRFVNLVASTVNLWLFSSILKFVYGHNGQSQLKIVLQALNLAILPPLYFFSHVYYTDTLSVTFLLTFFRLCLVNKYKFSIMFFGLSSVLMRQINVIWVALVFGHRALDLFVKSSRVYGDLKYIQGPKKHILSDEIDKSKLKRYYDIKDVALAVKYHVSSGFVSFFRFLTFQDWSILLTHGVILFSFVIFLYVNGSIVVGDKTAHTATLHLPQMLYFLIFYGLFGLPYVLGKFVSTITMILRNKLYVVLLSVIFVLCVHYNTIVHPYLVADNRHYTFYVWNRWFGKYWFAGYATVPGYVFLSFSVYDNLKDQNCVSFLLPYVVCAFTALALQRMIEIRYFLIPYLVLRMRFVNPPLKMIIGEFLLYLVLNGLTFHLFFTKQIMWKDFDDVQRIIW